MPVAPALAVCGINGAVAVNTFNRHIFQMVADFAQIADKDICEMAVAMGAQTLLLEHCSSSKQGLWPIG